MKKIRLIALVLALVFIVSAIPVQVKAIPNEDVVTPLVDSSKQWLKCTKCDIPGNITRRWQEYNYYYTRYWADLVCPQCGYVWTTMIAEIEHNYMSEPIMGESE